MTGDKLAYVQDEVGEQKLQPQPTGLTSNLPVPMPRGMDLSIPTVFTLQGISSRADDALHIAGIFSFTVASLIFSSAVLRDDAIDLFLVFFGLSWWMWFATSLKRDRDSGGKGGVIKLTTILAFLTLAVSEFGYLAGVQSADPTVIFFGSALGIHGVSIAISWIITTINFVKPSKN